jgi:hypothetical protein
MNVFLASLASLASLAVSRSRLVALVVAAIVLFASIARADEEPDDGSAAALAAGAGVTFVSLGVGATMIGRGDNELVKNAGLLGAQSGMVLAPFVSHAIVGETMRGVWFSLPLLFPVGVNSALAAAFPSIIKHAGAGIQYMTFISFTLSVFGAGFGVLDAVRVSERRPKEKKSDLSLVPIFGNGISGAVVSGSL